MKKILAAVLLIMVTVFTFALTACATAAVTKVFPRWEDEEEYVFGISLADFDPEKKTLFKTYGEKNDYFRDMVISTAESAALLTSDEIRPEKLTGELSYKISKVDNSTNRQFTTVQKVYAQYKTEVLEQSSNYDDLKTVIAENDPFGDSGYTTLYSETTTEVVFKNEAINDVYIVPVSSHKTEKGFYVGNVYQGVSNYEITTEYDFDNRVAKVTNITKNAKGEEIKKTETANKLGIAKNGYCIDSNMLLLYVRSLNKGSGDFASTPSVLVYNAYDNKISTAVFGITRDQKVVLKNNGTDFLTTLNVVGVTIDNQAFMLQENLSDKIAETKTDVLQGNSKYTTVRFRVGMRAYELKEYKTEWLDAIKIVDEKNNSLSVAVTKAGSVDLITQGKLHNDVVISWELKEGGEYVKLENNKLVVDSLPTEKKTVKLVATVSCGSITETKEIDVTIPAAK